MSTYLGFDASTQSLTAMLVEIDDDARRVIFEDSFRYDDALPKYGTTHGVREGTEPGVAFSPPLMWIEAIDVMMARLVKAHPAEMASVSAISGSAQQHGSVYLNAAGVATLMRLDARTPIVAQMSHAFPRSVAPVWMDSSTAAECREIADALGGDRVLTERTGSRAFERFTGPQIRRFFKHDPRAYAATHRIHLVSSFLASILAGADAPVDPGDGSGTNLMDPATSTWWPAALDATAPDLATKLPSIAASSSVVGTLAPYWRERYGLPAARVIAWSGDNPCSLVGTGVVGTSRAGCVSISLGTSDTIARSMLTPHTDSSMAGSVFGAPTGEFMGLTCFKNGSLARERVRDAYALDWAGFSAALRATPAGNAGAMMLPWFEPEITPDVPAAGVHRHDLRDTDGPANVRAIVEAQMMAMANHSQWMGVEMVSIHATGGAAVNPEILQIMADVFNAGVFQMPSGNSACLGAALRAYHADALASGRAISWDQTIAGLAEPLARTRVPPIADHVSRYADLRARYAEWETRVLYRSRTPSNRSTTS